MFIQTEQTPNPQTLKFLPGRSFLARGSADFPTAETAFRSPLAQRLFAVESVKSVFVGTDFVTVTKAEEADWFRLKPQILAALMDALTEGLPALLASPETSGAEAGATGSEGDAEEDEIVVQIKDLIDTRVRPAVAQDGGDIVFDRFEAGIVFLHMQGSCSGCPSSTATLKMGIENMLKHYVPEVVEVRAV